MTDNKISFTPELEIPEYLQGEVRSKLAYVDELIYSGVVDQKTGKVELSLRHSLTEKEKDRVIAKAQKVITTIVKGAFKPKVKILEDHLDRTVTYKNDPMEELITRREVSQEADGIYVVGPLLTRLIAYFENIFLNLANEYKAEPYRFPTLIPARYLERVNYFRAFPHSLSFATHLHSDLDVIEDFSEHAHCEEGVLSTNLESFSKFQTLLSPAVCYHLYFALADKPLPGDQLAATAVGNCFRYESSNLVSLERLWNFTMREIIFVGSKEFVLDNRESARKWMEDKLKATGLSYGVESASDPFFIGEFKQAAFQNAFQLKYEIRARLPFKNSTLAVGSYNYHQDFFGRNLNITLSNGKPVHTGCVAFGLERIAYAFLAQFGLDPIKFPGDARKWFEQYR